MARFINKKNALERSNLSHTRLNRIAFARKDIVSADYHQDVAIKQYNKKRILTKRERKNIFENHMKKHGVI